MSAQTVDSRLRRWLFMLAGFIFLGTVVELVLQDHTKETVQLIPFVLCAIGFITVTTVLLRPQRATVLALRGVMTLVMAGGLYGMALHLTRNFQFEQEIRPNAEIADLLLKTLKGAAPLLAPGILVFAAIIALIASYYHPALGSDGTVSLP